MRVLVPFPAAGGTDILARLFLQKVSERLGANFVIDNRAGAGGTIGTEIVAKAPPDGYTILVCSSSHTINPSVYRKLGYDPIRDFAPVTMLASGPGLLVVHPSVPARNVKELIAFAKSKPGQLISLPRATARRPTSLPSFSSRWRVSTWFTSPTRATSPRSSI